LVGLALLAPAANADGPPVTTSSALSPQLTELTTPAVRSQSLAGQAKALGLPSAGPGALIRQGGKVIVEAHFETDAIAAIDAVKATGARVLDASRRYQTLVLSIPPAKLPALAAIPGVSAVNASLKPEVAGIGAGGGTTAAVNSNGLCEGGSVITEGLEQLNVAAARGAFGARGSGKTIGVISNSFDSATLGGNGEPVATTAHDDELSNDLPGPASTCSGQQLPVNVIAEDPTGKPAAEYTDEGRAMLQVVHDLAPKAKLAFATGEPSEISYAQNIERLAAPVSAGGAGADVIVDDLIFESEPFFQDGPVAAAIRRVTEKGVLYFTAAGNDNLFDAEGNEISSWEAPEYRGDTACNDKVVELLDAELAGEGKGPYEPDCMDFDPGAAVDTEFGITVDPGSQLSLNLQWAEPWYGVETAFFAFVLTGSGGGEEVATGGGSNTLGITPHIPIAWTNEAATAQTVRVVIARCAGSGCNPEASSTSKPRIKLAILEDGGGVSAIEYPKSEGGDVVGPVIYGHRGSTAATTIAAVNYQESSTAPTQPEPYSSRGPVTHYFGPVNGTTPAAALGSPLVIPKPDIAATDCASTTFFEIFAAGGWHFCGSSQAAEHAATVAALMQQAEPFATPEEIVSNLESTATKFTDVDSPSAVGAGMVNALGAMTALGASPVADPASSVVPSLEEEAAAPGPVVQITAGPRPLGNEPRPTFEFSSTLPASFSCQVDDGPSRPCASPYAVPTPLADGPHSFVVTATDSRGRTGASAPYDFTVDTVAPRAKISTRPKQVVKTARRSTLVRFGLRSSQSPATFYCRIDNGPRQTCPPRFQRRFGLGRHVLRVRAKDAAGNLAVKDAVFRFRVERAR